MRGLFVNIFDATNVCSNIMVSAGVCRENVRVGWCLGLYCRILLIVYLIETQCFILDSPVLVKTFPNPCLNAP